MKKAGVLVAILLIIGCISAQNKVVFYNDGNIIYQSEINNVDSVCFRNNISIVHNNKETINFQYPVAGIDSIVFVDGTTIDDDDSTNTGGEVDTATMVSIIFGQDTAYIHNPYADSGVVITTSGAFVTVQAAMGKQNIVYYLSGATDNGALSLTSDEKIILWMDGVSIHNPKGAAIKIPYDVKVSAVLNDSTVSVLEDDTASTDKAAFDSKGQIIFSGMGTLNVIGNAKHGIFSSDYVKVQSGNINIIRAIKDGIHGDYFQMYAGTVTINAGTGIDGETGFVGIYGGDVTITTAQNDGKSIKCDSIIDISGGTLTLTVSGNQAKGLKAGKSVYFKGGNTYITATGTTVLEAEGNGYNPSFCSAVSAKEDVNIYFGADMTIVCDSNNQGGKAISADGNINVYGGNLNISVAGASGEYVNANNINDSYNSVCLKSNKNVNIHGGTFVLSALGDGSKGISADSSVLITKGNLTFYAVGKESKGIKADHVVSITGGKIGITASGETVIANYETSFCSGIKSDGNIYIADSADITINCTSTNNGGKALKANGNITIDGGTLLLNTAGSGSTYTLAGGTKDGYSSACMKADGNIYLKAGNISCTSSGAGGKGINAEGSIVIGDSTYADSALVLSVTTSGQRFTISSSSGGGGWTPPGGNTGNYSNPKGIKSTGNLIINNGIIRVNCTQSGTEGGECIESKSSLIINGGNIEASSVYDDAINAAVNLTINGGLIYATSGHNDGIDCNGTMNINGGLAISAGARAPEEGFDCDNNTFTITGGIIVGTGGATSSPNAGTQKALKYSATQGTAICIYNSSNQAVLTMQLPTMVSGGGGGWNPGGGSGMVVLMSSPLFTSGSYTLKYGGTITGGTSFHGYYTNATYSNGSSKTFTIGNNVLTTIQ